MTDKFQPEQKVRVKYIDAIGREMFFDGKIVRHETKYSMWRVDIGGVAVVFAEEDIE